jgi:hypothetical protein
MAGALDLAAFGLIEYGARQMRAFLLESAPIAIFEMD